MSSGNVLCLKTVQVLNFRTLMTALKDILLETNITFKPDGMRIISMDKSHTILVHLFLPADKFEFYECKHEKIIVGVNVAHLFKLVNFIKVNETLTICIADEDYADGVVSNLTLIFENNEIKQHKTKKLKLIEPDGDELEYPNITFSCIINMPSTDFQKIINESASLSDKIEIKSVGNELIFKCAGSFASSEIVRSESDGSMCFLTKQDNQSKIVQGEFSLKNLGYFTKCTNLCNQIEIYLENDIPLVVKYNVASLGSIRLCLANLPT